jgi:hypothetical protein
MAQFVYSVVGAVLIAAIVYIYNERQKAGKYKLPPLVEGGVPILGNSLQLRPLGHEAGEVTRKWAEKYGEM